MSGLETILYVLYWSGIAATLIIIAILQITELYPSRWAKGKTMFNRYIKPKDLVVGNWYYAKFARGREYYSVVWIVKILNVIANGRFVHVIIKSSDHNGAGFVLKWSKVKFLGLHSVHEVTDV